MAQKFYASPTDTLTHPNGAIAHRTGGAFDCLGPYAKIRNCPITLGGVEVARLTAYATGYADTAFSVPACTRYKGRHIAGYFTTDDDGAQFRVMDRHADRFKTTKPREA